MDQPLSEYRKKRDFRATSEPPGRAARQARGRALSYVIQRHQASHLHYDFRLELDGVLVSWAVPKGPSRDPGVKRLAVRVEDHPLEYGKFEGDIPEGHYGAGHVDIWDSGTWIPEGDPGRGLARGHLHFTLRGGAMRGEWVLLRLGRNGKQWLLRKLDDRYAVPGDDAEDPAGAAGGTPRRRQDDDPQDNGPLDGAARRRKAAAGAARAGRKAAMPASIEPQLATLVDRPPDGPGWSYEVKYDGYRVLCRIGKGRRGVDFRSRNGGDWTARMRPLADALARLDLGAGWIDGEVVSLDERGLSDFQRLQNALDGEQQGLVFVAFDLPYWNGRDLRALPLSERQARLQALLADLPADAPLRMTQRLEVNDGKQGRAAWGEACRLGLEGLICKRLDAPYSAGRGKDWLKLKCRPRQEFVIGGYTAPSGSRRHFGALLVGLRKGGALQYAGRVGTGYTAEVLASLHRRLRALHTGRSPFSAPLPGSGRYGSGRPGSVQWVRPELVAEVNYAGITDDGLLRQASFAGLREDKPASQVSGETPADPPAADPSRGAAPDGVRVTHPDRIVLRKPDTRKLDLVQYYESAAGLMMPHLRGRRVALLRCPEGVDGECFFQKHISGALPPGLERQGQDLVIREPRGLLELAQIGVIEFHTWGSRDPRGDNPDRITIDLDPGEGVDWRAVAEGARLVQGLMREVGLAPFLKTTGGKGLHLVAPLRPTQDWDTVKDFSHALASELERVIPERFIASMSKARRRGRIFVDYLRNGNGATAIAAYSARARDGAPVSMPLPWEALDEARDLRGDACNIRNALALAREYGDAWKDYEASRRTLGPRMLKKLGMWGNDAPGSH
ncbi:DNA ligase D [Achromobacter sp. Marseille-Q4962]|uniref:DNA ligase D n=1 Tax=Achromobacter sp. Marseille-Q4962 TaxID=2942202 RepID=UPI00207485B1|nr:DNA ligase D [Achromobacter sp. Marseille-Q4962]